MATIDIERSLSYKETCDAIRARGRLNNRGYERIVFTNGCFDVIHVGHVLLLKRARELAGPLGAVVVGLNSDDSVRRVKGDCRPVFDCDSRAMVLMSMRYVDHVVVFDEDTPFELIKELRPTLIVKGGEYKNASDVVGHDISPVVLCTDEKRFSTTDTIEKIITKGLK